MHLFSLFVAVRFVLVLYDRWLAIDLGQARCHIEFYVNENTTEGQTLGTYNSVQCA